MLETLIFPSVIGELNNAMFGIFSVFILLKYDENIIPSYPLEYANFAIFLQIT